MLMWNYVAIARTRGPTHQDTHSAMHLTSKRRDNLLLTTEKTAGLKEEKTPSLSYWKNLQ